MATKYLGAESAGVAFTTEETRSVVVTLEALDKSSGYEGDTVVYTATVKDDLGNALPETFVASLIMNATVLIADQAFGVAVYDPATFELTLSFTVPAGEGSFTVKLSWAEQTI